MIRQDDERFKNKWIKDFGCAYFSILYYVNKFTNKPFNIAKIEIYFEQMKASGCFTEDLDVLWENAFKFFNIDVSVQVKPSTYKAKKGEFVIAKWHNEKTGYSHFTPVTGNVCTFDSLGESVTVRDGFIDSFRVFKIVK